MLPGVRRWVLAQNERWESLIFLSQQSNYRRAGTLKGHADHLYIERELRKAGQKTFDLMQKGQTKGPSDRPGTSKSGSMR
jgi:hypothetical protein